MKKITTFIVLVLIYIKSFSQELIYISAKRRDGFVSVKWKVRYEPDEGMYMVSRWTDTLFTNIVGLKDVNGGYGIIHNWIDGSPDFSQKYYSVLFIPKDELIKKKPSGIIIGRIKL